MKLPGQCRINFRLQALISIPILCNNTQGNNQDNKVSQRMECGDIWILWVLSVLVCVWKTESALTFSNDVCVCVCVCRTSMFLDCTGKTTSVFWRFDDGLIQLYVHSNASLTQFWLIPITSCKTFLTTGHQENILPSSRTIRFPPSFSLPVMSLRWVKCCFVYTVVLSPLPDRSGVGNIGACLLAACALEGIRGQRVDVSILGGGFGSHEAKMNACGL